MAIAVAMEEFPMSAPEAPCGQGPSNPKVAEECHLVDTARITANTYMRDFKAVGDGTRPLVVSRWKAYCWMLDQALRQNFATVVIR